MASLTDWAVVSSSSVQTTRQRAEDLTLNVVLDDASLDVSDLLTSGFPSPDLLAAAVDQLPHRDAASAGDFRREGPVFAVDATAGVISLRAQNLAVRERTLAADTGAIPSELIDDDETASVRAARSQLRQDFPDVDVRTGEILEPTGQAAGVITSWSPRSRARMVRTVASVDWRPLLEVGVPVMVTLTYPGPWQALAPTGAHAKRALERFKERWRKEFGSPATVGMWKYEAQRRGAPHFHILLPMVHRTSLDRLRTWVADNWRDAVWHEFLRDHDGLPDEYRVHWDRHLRAGTAVDLREGLRCRDPKRIAVYFLKHSSKTGDGKEYQHKVPELWHFRGAGPGRYWGVWGVEQPKVSSYVDVRTFVQLRRIMWRWRRANGGRVWGTSRLTGTSVLVNDGPAFLSQLARALSAMGIQRQEWTPEVDTSSSSWKQAPGLFPRDHIS